MPAKEIEKKKKLEDGTNLFFKEWGLTWDWIKRERGASKIIPCSEGHPNLVFTGSPLSKAFNLPMLTFPQYLSSRVVVKSK